MRRPVFQRVLALVGIESTPRGHFERVLSGVIAFVGIGAVWLVSTSVVGASVPLVVASMGASAVLLFAVPHGALSQPWPVLGGHVLSALVGVTCARAVDNPLVAAPLSVGLAISVMYYARCIHPPGGATALTAVIGGQAIHQLGYSYVLAPVALNALILLTVAVLANWPFPWRRYPAALGHAARSSKPVPPAISHEHLSYALRQMGSLVDVAEEDLVEIYALALQHARGTHLPPEQIRVGRCYANDRSSPSWSVRQVLEEEPGTKDGEKVVLYRVVEGLGQSAVRRCTLGAFALWATQEMPMPAQRHSRSRVRPTRQRLSAPTFVGRRSS
jgi:CBS domain-containing membrane protein